MKRCQLYPILATLLLLCISSNAQVTKLFNKDISGWGAIPLSNRLIVMELDSSSFADGNLWSTDGNGPLQRFASGVTYINYFWEIFNNKVYFFGSSAAGIGIYVTDGTDAGTQLVTTKIAQPRNPTICNGLMFFEGTNNDEYQLWETDGTDAGTKVVKNMPNGLPVDDYFFAANNTLYFTAVGQPDSSEVWKTDGTEAGTVHLVTLPSTANDYQLYCVNFSNFIDGKVLFYQFAGGGVTWETDGTPAGTQQTEVNLYNVNGVLLNDKYYFIGASPTSSYNALFITDGTTAGTKLLQDSTGITFSSLLVNNKLISKANNVLYTFDTTLQRIQAIDTFYNFIEQLYAPLYPGSSNISLFQNGYNTYKGNKVFFVASDSTDGPELWQTDGTSLNTKMVKAINRGPGGAFTIDLFSDFGPQYQIDTNYCYVPAGIYFAATDSVHGVELWQSDGTAGGTQLVKDINPGGDDSYPQFIGTANNHVFFTAFDSGFANSPNDVRRLFVIDADNSTLPVSLIDFGATPVKQNVAVNWTTSAEVNTSFFNVQRSTDAMTFENIGKVAAAGNSTVKINYQFTDVNALTLNVPFLYYRLQINDKDGHARYSNVVRIPVTGATDFKVYPNPTKSLLSINYSLPAGENANLRITDINGKTVLIQTVSSNTNTVDVSALAAGVYYIQVVTKTGVKTDKFIKQ